MRQIKTCFMITVNYTGYETGKKRDEVMRALELVGCKNHKKYVGVFVDEGCEIIMHKSTLNEASSVMYAINTLVEDVSVKIMEL